MFGTETVIETYDGPGTCLNRLVVTVSEVYFTDGSGRYAVFDNNTVELRDENDEVIRSMERVRSSNNIRDELALLLDTGQSN